jgi:hypothetical protein
MPEKRRSFTRRCSNRTYRKLFVIATEGAKTEPQYFNIFQTLKKEQVIIHLRKGKNKSDPENVLKRMKEYLKTERLKPSDEAWMVVDKDQWRDDQIDKLHEWTKQQKNYGLALSNPKFEYWLLLHFADGDIRSGQNIEKLLDSHLPSYSHTKAVDPLKFKLENIEKAISRAKKRDAPPCEDWPRLPNRTTVYKLVSNILNS